MRWTRSSFYRLVSLPYHITLVAPLDVDALQNPSRISSVPQLQDLWDDWTSGQIHFQKLSDAEFAVYAADMGKLEEEKGERVDKGKRRPKRPVETRSKKKRLIKQDLTPEFVDESRYAL